MGIICLISFTVNITFEGKEQETDGLYSIDDGDADDVSKVLVIITGMCVLVG